MLLRILSLLLVAGLLMPLASVAQEGCYECKPVGDLDLDGIAASVADVTLYDRYMHWGLAVFVIQPDWQIAESDFNCDGLPLSIADFVWAIRVLNNDSAICCLDSSGYAAPPGWLTGSAQYRVAVGDFEQDQDFSRGHVPIRLEQITDPILGFQLALEFDAAGVFVDSILPGPALQAWNLISIDKRRTSDTATIQILAHYNSFQEEFQGNPVLTAGTELARIYVSYDATASQSPHLFRFLFEDCNDNGMTLASTTTPGSPAGLLVSNDVWEDGVTITDPTSIYGGIDSCCIDTSMPAQPQRAIDFVNNAVSFPEDCCIGMRGDVNGDGVDADPADLSMLVDALFRCGDLCVPCLAEANIDGTGLYYDPVDLAYLIDYLFVGGAPPPMCDAPVIYDWTSYDLDGLPVAAGILNMAFIETTQFGGTYDIQPVNNPQQIGPQTGTGYFEGRWTGAEFAIDLGQNSRDNTVEFLGSFSPSRDTLSGVWVFISIAGPTNDGTFEAVRR